MKRHDMLIGTLLIISITLFLSSYNALSQGIPLNSNRNLSINLKSKALVLGPKIKLGDIGKVIVPDSLKKLQLSSIELGEAPPPGESSDLSLNYIKRRLKSAGFEEFISYIKGPKTIRVTTAQVEIDKAFPREEFASVLKLFLIAVTQLKPS
jgi:hypothetical protein